MVEFLRKFENRVIKIHRDNSIFITKIYQITDIYFNFVRCWGSVVMLTFLNSPPAQSIYREVYAITKF